jgi:CheY-specific phosphatase CheX
VKLKKYVMLVDDEVGPLARLIPRLRDLDFRIVRVPDAAAAMEFVRAFPKLSMVAISDTRDPKLNRELLASIRELQPDLPLLWHGAPSSLPVGETAELLPHHSLTAGDLVACAERLLCQHFYPADFATFLAENALAAFSCFGAHATSADPFLKASRARLAELSAVIAFAGQETSGHLVVSAPREVVSLAYLRLFGDPSPPDDDALVDVLGESGNRIIGKLATYLEKRGMAITFGVPLYLAGSHCVLWQGAHRPALAVEFETVNGRLFAELCMDAFDPSNSHSHSNFPDQLLQSGQCILL